METKRDNVVMIAPDKNIVMHFAGLYTDEIIQVECENIRELIWKWLENYTPKAVTLISIENKTFVSHFNKYLKWFIINNSINTSVKTDVFIQEYNSYEEAYAVALNMAEVYPNCYE